MSGNEVAMIRGALATVLVSLTAVPSVAAAELCSEKARRIIEMPGPRLGEFWRDLKVAVPATAGCEDRQKDGCSFIDSQGYEIAFAFSEVRPGRRQFDREHFMKTAVRSRGGKLPYNVTWSDGPDAVVRRIKAVGSRFSAGAEKDGRWISAHGCETDWSWTTFNFSKAGRLESVEQAFHKY